MPDPISVLFVCYGNICRSTMSEGVFKSMVKEPPYKDIIGRVDSCGTASYHIGDNPDSRTMATLATHGIKDYVHAARKIRPSDFDTFDYILAMDHTNRSELQRLQSNKPGSKAKVQLFGDYSGTGKFESVEDPYYGGPEGFEMAYEQAVRFSTNFLKAVFPDVHAEA